MASAAADLTDNLLDSSNSGDDPSGVARARTRMRSRSSIATSQLCGRPGILQSVKATARRIGIGAP
jgi:hypothetical protein